MRRRQSEDTVKASDSDWTKPVHLTTGQSFTIQRVPEQHWFEIELVDEFGDPAAGETFRLVLPDGSSLLEDRLDSNGRARIEAFVAAECLVTFPDLEGRSWAYVGANE